MFGINSNAPPEYNPELSAVSHQQETGSSPLSSILQVSNSSLPASSLSGITPSPLPVQKTNAETVIAELKKTASEFFPLSTALFIEKFFQPLPDPGTGNYAELPDKPARSLVVPQCCYNIVTGEKSIEAAKLSCCSAIAIIHGDTKSMIHIYGSRLSFHISPQWNMQGEDDRGPRGGDIILMHCKALTARPDILTDSKLIVMFGPEIYTNYDNHDPETLNPLSVIAQEFKDRKKNLHQPLLNLLALFKQENIQFCHGENLYINEHNQVSGYGDSDRPVNSVSVEEKNALFKLLPAEPK